MLSIKVLGPGCANCRQVEAVARQAISTLGIEVQIEKITDYHTMMQYHILATPGLVINEELVSAGRIPSEAEVITWASNALAVV